MCAPGQPRGRPPDTAAEAVAAATSGLGFLGQYDAASLPADAQAETLMALERAESMLTAARARILSAFTSQTGYAGDGQYGPKPWLIHFTRVTRGAAGGATGWARRLQAHPAIAAALSAGQISTSWAQNICNWTDRLPEASRADADAILLAAAAGGADLHDLAVLATEMYERSRATQPDSDEDGDDGFGDRSVQLDSTFGGAGRLDGDLTAGCTAALQAVLDSLGGRQGAEDDRSQAQRHHDALEEACKRLIAARLLPDRAGQDTQVQVHIPLSQLRDMPGASEAEAAWLAARAGEMGYLAGTSAEAAACDATLIPVVTGHVDWDVVEQMTGLFLQAHGLAHTPATAADPQTANATGTGTTTPATCQCSCGQCTCPARQPLSDESRRRLQHALLAIAADAMSGPAGLAAHLRTRLLGAPFTTKSLPLDIGYSDDIPAWIRRAVILRDQHCQFPGGWRQPPAACQIHHHIPRSKGGITSLANCHLLCRFHHLIAVHQWGWRLTFHPDGTATATSPQGRTLHSHSPPAQAA
jgi:hypothetical protein